MSKDEILLILTDKIGSAKNIIKRVDAGELNEHFKTKKAKQECKLFQYGYIKGLKVARQYIYELREEL